MFWGKLVKALWERSNSVTPVQASLSSTSSSHNFLRDKSLRRSSSITLPKKSSASRPPGQFRGLPQQTNVSLGNSEKLQRRRVKGRGEQERIHEMNISTQMNTTLLSFFIYGGFGTTPVDRKAIRRFNMLSLCRCVLDNSTKLNKLLAWVLCVFPQGTLRGFHRRGLGGGAFFLLLVFLGNGSFLLHLLLELKRHSGVEDNRWAWRNKRWALNLGLLGLDTVSHKFEKQQKVKWGQIRKYVQWWYPSPMRM